MATLTIDGVTHTAPAGECHGAWAGPLLRAARACRHVELEGEWRLQDVGLDVTQWRAQSVIDASKARVLAACPGVVLDLTDSTGVVVHDLRIESDGTPDVGILCSRASESAYRVSGKHRFTDCYLVGGYRKVSVAVIGSESNVWARLRADNNDANALAAVYFGARNLHGFVSINPALTPGNNSSETGQYVEAMHVEFGGTSALALGAVVVDGFDRVVLEAPYIKSTRAPHLLVDATRDAVIGPYVRELYAHGHGSSKPEYSVRAIGLPSIGTLGTTLTARRLVFSTAPILLAGMKYTALSMEHIDVGSSVVESGATFFGRCTITERGVVRELVS